MTAHPTAAQRKRQWDTWRGFGIGAAAVVCGVALIWALFGPAAEWLARHDIGTAKGSVLETALQNARSAYLTLAAGILAGGALVFTARNHALSQKQHNLEREGQVTDRYTKAIEQLGSDNAGVRIGGIFALERIALDSLRDHPTIMEVLAAFLREQSVPAPPKGSLALFLSSQSDSSGNKTPAAQEAPPSAMPQDVRAAITVIGRRDASRDSFRDGQGLDLEKAHLVRANLASAILAKANLFKAVLHNANLASANLSGATLNEADLRYADLRRANLSRADLGSANLVKANLQGADLGSANLASANLHLADLRRANLYGANLASSVLASSNLAVTNLLHANLASANLRHADLKGAKLGNANLASANLHLADLSGANLSEANLASADLRGASLNGAYWPSAEIPPPGWQMGSDGRLLPVP